MKTTITITKIEKGKASGKKMNPHIHPRTLMSRQPWESPEGFNERKDRFYIQLEKWKDFEANNPEYEIDLESFPGENVVMFFTIGKNLSAELINNKWRI